MGTAPFAIPSLRAMIDAGHEIVGVFTQPDRPRGRGRKIQAPAVKAEALELKLPVYQPESIKTDSIIELFGVLAPRLIVVVAYGKIIPGWLIDLPPHGVVNVHGSLLPRYRGAAPVNWAIARGETHSGVCTMQIERGLDTGPVYLSAETAIDPEETAVELASRLAEMGAPLLVETVDGIDSGSIRPTPQDEQAATRAPMMTKEDGALDWSESAASIHNKVRAFAPWPSALVRFRGKSCKILSSRISESTDDESSPGAIICAGDRLKVVCGDGRLLELMQVQMENRGAVRASDFMNGMRVQAGEKFDGGRTRARGLE
jgi:methionyl-tRNA formyltransferase